MITIDLGTVEYYDDSTDQFIYVEGGVVRFEYTLKVLYRWEGKYKKPFFKKEHITEEEILDFYRMMALDPFDDKFLTQDVIKVLSDYVGDSHTATTFYQPPGQNDGSLGGKGKIYTAEELYALMFMAHIPLEWENRNLNRLLTIIRIISNYNSPPKKMSREEVLKQNQELNRQRRAQLKTKG